MDNCKNRRVGDAAVGQAIRWVNDRIADTAIAKNLQVSIRAEFIGSNRCVAFGITARCHAPALELCRRLVVAGYDPASSLEVYRADVLCLTVSSISAGALLSVEDDRHGRPRLRRWRNRVRGCGGAAPDAETVYVSSPVPSPSEAPPTKPAPSLAEHASSEDRE